MCQEFCSQQGSTWAGAPPSRYPPGRYSPLAGTSPRVQCMLGDMGIKWVVRILLECILVTGRNEVVAMVMFLHVSVILSTGGVLQAGRPPGTRQTPPPQLGEPPLWLGDHPPRTRQTPQTPPWLGDHPPRDQADPPGWENPPRLGDHPPGTRQTPPGKQTSEYGLRAAGTHPIGMNSCYTCSLSQEIGSIEREINWIHATTVTFSMKSSLHFCSIVHSLISKIFRSFVIMILGRYHL